jgi:hypothetical protein
MIAGAVADVADVFEAGAHPLANSSKMRNRMEVFMASLYVCLNRNSPVAGGVSTIQMDRSYI